MNKNNQNIFIDLQASLSDFHLKKAAWRTETVLTVKWHYSKHIAIVMGKI